MLFSAIKIKKKMFFFFEKMAKTIAIPKKIIYIINIGCWIQSEQR